MCNIKKNPADISPLNSFWKLQNEGEYYFFDKIFKVIFYQTLYRKIFDKIEVQNRFNRKLTAQHMC